MPHARFERKSTHLSKLRHLGPCNGKFRYEASDVMGDQTVNTLVVDLDGSLSKVDALAEMALALLLRHPLKLLRAALEARNRLNFKTSIFKLSGGQISDLPLQQSVVELIQSRGAVGGKVVLATASIPEIANSVASRIPEISEVFASHAVNLKGKAKAELLAERFGTGGFDYVGDSSSDLEVWMQSDKALFVGSQRKMEHLSKKLGRKIQVVGETKTTKGFVRQLRISHWVKNLLLFAAPVLAFSTELEGYLRLTVVFFAFSFMASAFYTVNDLLDINSDRLHPEKKYRPIAAGDLGALKAGLLTPLLMTLAAISAFASYGLEGLAWVFFYGSISGLYSFRLKRIPVVDVISLSLLYVLRIIAGAELTQTDLTFWFLTFSLLVFLALALMKRTVELAVVAPGSGIHSASIRGYGAEDLGWVRGLGLGISAVTVLVLALYMEDRFDSSNNLLSISLIIVSAWTTWIGRLWFDEAHRKLHSDPVRHALTSPWSVATLMVVGASYLLAVQFGG